MLQDQLEEQPRKETRELRIQLPRIDQKPPEEPPEITPQTGMDHFSTDKPPRSPEKLPETPTQPTSPGKQPTSPRLTRYQKLLLESKKKSQQKDNEQKKQKLMTSKSSTELGTKKPTENKQPTPAAPGPKEKGQQKPSLIGKKAAEQLQKGAAGAKLPSAASKITTQQEPDPQRKSSRIKKQPDRYQPAGSEVPTLERIAKAERKKTRRSRSTHATWTSLILDNN